MNRSFLSRVVHSPGLKHGALFLFFAAIAFVSLRTMVFSSGVPVGPEWEMPPFPEQIKQMLERKLTPWTTAWELGVPRDSTAGLWYSLFIALFAYLGLGGDFIGPFAAVLFLALAGYFAFYLAQQLKLATIPSMLAGLFYMLAPYVFTRLNMGHLGILFGYAFIPLTLAFFIRFTREGHKLRWLLLATLAMALASETEQQFTVLLIILSLFLMVEFWGKPWRQAVHDAAGFAFIAFVSGAILNMFWVSVINQLTYRTASFFFGGLPARFFLDPGIWPEDFFRLLDSRLDYTQQVATQWHPWLALSFLPPMLALATFLLQPKDRRVLYFLLLTFIGILLVSGGALPLWGKIWLWAQERFSPLAMFRDTPWFYAVPSLGMAMLFALFTQFSPQLLARFSSKTRLALHSVVWLAISSTLILSTWPFFTGDLGGKLQTYQYSQAQKQVFDLVSQDPEDFRVLPLPGPYPHKYLDQKGEGYFPDAMSSYPGKSTLAFARLYEPQIERFLFRTIYDKRPLGVQEILSLMNVKYVILDANKKSTGTDIFPVETYFPEEKYSNDKIVWTLERQKDLASMTTRGPIEIFLNEQYLPHISPVPQLALVAGDLDVLASLSSIEGIKLKDMGLVFVSQLSQQDLNTLARTPQVSFIIQDGHYPELLLAAASRQQYELNFLDVVGTRTPESGWAILWWYWHNWYMQATLDRVAYTLIPSSLELPFNIKAEGDHQIYLKLYFAPSAISVKVYVDETQIATVETKSMGEDFRWISAGPVHLPPGKHTLRLESKGWDALASAIVIPQEVLASAEAKLAGLMQGKPVSLLSELSWQGPPKDIWGWEGQELAELLPQGGRRYPARAPYDIGLKGDVATIQLPFTPGQDESYNWQYPVPIKAAENLIFEFSYRLQDPGVQSLSLIWDVDYDGDDRADVWLRVNPSLRPEEPSKRQRADGIYDVSLPYSAPDLTAEATYSVDIGEALTRFFPDKQAFMLTGLKMSFEKAPGAETPEGASYTFYVKKLRLLSKGGSFSLVKSETASAGTASLAKTASQFPTQTVFIPQSGVYHINLRGSSQGSPLPVSISVNGSEFSTQLNSSKADFQYQKVAEVYLPQGLAEISITIPQGGVILDQLVLSQPLPPSGPPVQLTSKKLKATRYQISAQAATPFYLFFSERYHPNWKLTVPGEGEERSYPGYSFGNMFLVDKTGSLSLQLDYEGQKYYDLGLPLSFASLAVMLLLILMPQGWLEAVASQGWLKLRRILARRN